MGRCFSPRWAALVVAIVAGCAPAATNAAADAGLENGTLKVVLSEWSLGFDEVQTDQGKLTVTVVNVGRFPHNLTVTDKGGGKVYEQTANLRTNETAEFELSLEPGEYELYCSIPGHRDAGMVASLVVGAAAAPAPSGGSRGGYY